MAAAPRRRRSRGARLRPRPAGARRRECSAARARARRGARRGRRDHDAALARGRPRATLGPGGLAEGLARRLALHRHVDGAAARSRASSRRHSRRAGIDALDAPVSGGTIGAEAGTLTIMVGGAEAAAERARPLLRGARDARGARRRPRPRARPRSSATTSAPASTWRPSRRALALARSEGLDPARALRADVELDRRLARPAHALPGAGQRDDAGRARLRADVHRRPDGEGSGAGRAARGRARPRGASRWPRRSRSTGARRQEGHGSLDYSAIALTTGGARSCERAHRAAARGAPRRTSACSARPCASTCRTRSSRCATRRSPRAPAASATTRPT